jgi:hypothetical protein
MVADIPVSKQMINSCLNVVFRVPMIAIINHDNDDNIKSVHNSHTRHTLRHNDGANGINE